MRKAQNELQPVAVSVKTASEMLGISPPTLYGLINERRYRFPFFRVGSRTLISVDGLRDWVEQQVQQSTADSQ